MKKSLVLCLGAVLLLFACEDGFKEAPISKCFTPSIASSLPVAEENPCSTRAFWVSQTDDALVLEIQMLFVCSGIKYGYNANVDEAVPSTLSVAITKERSGDTAKCVCCKRMTVTYEGTVTELEKITQVQISGDDWQMDPIVIENP